MMRVALYLCLLAVSFSALGADEVKNTAKPKGKAQTIEFTEDLVIGPDDEGGIWAGLNVFVSVDDKGTMYITDSSAQRVQVFDAKGNFVKSLGGPGEGPGEFIRLIIFQISPDGSATAFENRPVPRFTYFDKDKNFINRKALEMPGHEFAFARISPNGKLFGGEFGVFAESGPIPYKAAVFTIDGELKQEITSNEIARPDFQSLLSNPDLLIGFISDNIRANARMGIVSFSDDGKIYTSKGVDYKVSVWDSSMDKELMVVSREYKPILKTEDEIESICDAIWEQLPFPGPVKEKLNKNMIRKAYEQAELPAGKNPVFGILPMKDGMFLVVHDFNQGSRIGTADIFDGKGQFLGSVTRPNQAFIGSANMVGSNKPRMVFKNDFAYAIEYRNDEEVLVRYRYKLVPAK